MISLRFLEELYAAAERIEYTTSANGAGEENEMPGIVTFKTLADALRAGYHVYDRTDHGYLVRTRTASGWAMAIVTCR
jgi:hypothetical protein